MLWSVFTVFMCCGLSLHTVHVLWSVFTHCSCAVVCLYAVHVLWSLQCSCAVVCLYSVHVLWSLFTVFMCCGLSLHTVHVLWPVFTVHVLWSAFTHCSCAVVCLYRSCAVVCLYTLFMCCGLSLHCSCAVVSLRAVHLLHTSGEGSVSSPPVSDRNSGHCDEGSGALLVLHTDWCTASGTLRCGLARFSVMEWAGLQHMFCCLTASSASALLSVAGAEIGI